MNAKRLLEGAAFLENLQLTDKVRFDIRDWYLDWSKVKSTDPRQERSPAEGFCGTQACALGHLAFAGLWGLRVVEYVPGMFEVRTHDGRFNDFRAAKRVFDIDEHAAFWLFSPEGYDDDKAVTKEMVAARMRHLAAGGTPDTWKEAA